MKDDRSFIERHYCKDQANGPQSRAVAETQPLINLHNILRNYSNCVKLIIIFEGLVYLYYSDLKLLRMENSLRYMGPKIWNSLPDDIKAADNIVIFKKVFVNSTLEIIYSKLSQTSTLCAIL